MVLSLKRDIFFDIVEAMEIPHIIFNPSGVVTTVVKNVHPLRGRTLKFNSFGVCTESGACHVEEG